MILVHRKLGQKRITLEDFIDLHNATTQMAFISGDKMDHISKNNYRKNLKGDFA